jgi:hypothetical protein
MVDVTVQVTSIRTVTGLGSPLIIPLRMVYTDMHEDSTILTGQHKQMQSCAFGKYLRMRALLKMLIEW